MEKSFNHQYDFIRIISALAVLTIHVTSKHIEVNSYAFILNQIVRFSVPMFILLGGLVTPSMDKEFNFILFYKKKLKSIFLPYISALCFYLLYEFYSSGIIFDIQYFTERIFDLFIYGYSHLYFLTIMLQLYLLYPLIRYFFIKNNKIILTISFLITLFFQSITFLIESNKILILPSFGKIPYYITFPLYIFYFVLGIHIKENPIKIKLDAFIVSLLWIFSCVTLVLESLVTSTAIMSIKPSIMLYTIITFLFLSSLYEHLKLHKFNSELRYLSSLTFGFYIMHIFVLQLAWKYLFISNFWNSIGGILLEIIIVTIITSSIIILYYKGKNTVFSSIKDK